MTTTEQTDLRPSLWAAFAQMSAVIAAVPPDALHAATPCAEFDVTALLAHVVGVAAKVVAVGRRLPLSGDAEREELAVPEWSGRFAALAADAEAAWADDTLLDELVTLPFATMAARHVAGVYVEELTTHSWDLATATGNTALLDPQLAELALAIMRRVLPAERRGGGVPFEAVVEVPDDAPAYHRLAGWLGRDPGRG